MVWLWFGLARIDLDFAGLRGVGDVFVLCVTNALKVAFGCFWLVWFCEGLGWLERSEGATVELGLFVGVCALRPRPREACVDEPESLILAQSERWRHA